MTLENPVIQPELDVRQLNRSLRRTANRLNRFSRGALRSVDRTSRTLARSLNTAAKSGALLATALTGAGAGLAAFSSNYVNDLRRAQALTGQTTEDIERFTTLLRAAGAENPLEGTTEIVREFANRLGEAAQDGTGAAFTAFQSLGLDVNDLQQRFARDSVGTIESVLARINQLGDNARETFNLEEIFGGQGSEIAQLVNNLTDYERSLIAIQSANRRIISPEQQANIQAQTREFGFLSENVRDLALQFGAQLAPSITDTLAGLNRFTRGIDVESVLLPFRRSIELTFSLLGTVARRTLPLFGRSFSFVLNRLETFGEWFRDNRIPILRFFSDVRARAEQFGLRVSDALSTAFDVQQEDGAGVVSRLGSFASAIINSNAVQRLREFFVSNFGPDSFIGGEVLKTVDVLIELFNALVTRFLPAVLTLISQIFGTAEQANPLLRTLGLTIEIIIGFVLAFVRELGRLLISATDLAAGFLGLLTNISNAPGLRQIIEGLNFVLQRIRDLPDIVRAVIVDIILAFVFPPSLVNSLPRYFARIFRFISFGFISDFIRVFSFIPRAIGNFFNRLFPNLQQRIFTNLANGLPTFVEDIIFALVDSVGIVLNFLRNIASRIRGTLNNLGITILGIFDAIARPIERVFPRIANLFRRIGEEINEFIAVIVNAFSPRTGPLNNIAAEVRELFDLIIAPFRAFRDVFARLLETLPVTGGNVVLTILETIRDFLQEINDITNDIIDLVPDIDFPDIGIPSFLNRNRGVTVPSGVPANVMPSAPIGATNNQIEINIGTATDSNLRQLKRDLQTIQQDSSFVTNVSGARRIRRRTAGATT